MNRIIFAILLFCQVVYSQDKYPTKSELQKILAWETKHKGHMYQSTNWRTLESDSSYGTADTLVFYNNSYYGSDPLLCNFIDWNFYKKDAFWKQTVPCWEPPASIMTDLDVFSIKILDEKAPMLLQVFKGDKLVDQFEVLSLVKRPVNKQEHNVSNILTLRRDKQIGLR